MENIAVANVIFILHVVFFLFMILAPFVKYKVFNLLYLIIAPFILFHWILNNDTCALTELEKKLRGTCHSKNTFFGSLVGPVYNLDKHPEVSMIVVRFILILLWFVALHNLRKKRNNDPIDKMYKIFTERSRPL